MAAQPVSAQIVGNAFVQQYYQILHSSPALVYRFYQDISTLGRPDDDGTMTFTTTMEGINEKIMSLNYGEFKAEIKSIDAQDSFNTGVLVLVTGYLTGKDNMMRDFAQTFFLAPQDRGGYFVLNDIFRYVEKVKHPDASKVSVDNGEMPLPSDQASPITIGGRNALVEEKKSTSSRDPMKHIVKIVTLLVAMSAIWIGLLQTSVVPESYTWLLPLYSIVSLGCYGLLMVGVGLMQFPTCPQESLSLQKDIVEAKEFLKQNGVDVGSD